MHFYRPQVASYYTSIRFLALFEIVWNFIYLLLTKLNVRTITRNGIEGVSRGTPELIRSLETEGR